jgi:hypothetical protein
VAAEGQQATPLLAPFIQKGGRIRMSDQRHQGPVIQPGALQVAITERKAEGLDQMEF